MAKNITEGAKPNFFLDLDSTCISAEPLEEYDFEKNKEKAQKFESKNMDGYYIVFERPGLQPFLDFLFENFNVSVWTAASKNYALFVIDKIILQKPGRKLDFVFYSYHCDASEHRGSGTKDLSLLWDVMKIPGYTKHNTVILDDYDDVYLTQKKNCIIAPPFEFSQNNSENDNFLSTFTDYLREFLEKFKQGKSVQELVPKLNQKIKKFERTSK